MHIEFGNISHLFTNLDCKLSDVFTIESCLKPDLSQTSSTKYQIESRIKAHVSEEVLLAG